MSTTISLQKLKELAEHRKNFCQKCGKPRYYNITVNGQQQQQVEHSHGRDAPAWTREQQHDRRDALEQGFYRPPEEIPEYVQPKVVNRVFSLTIDSLDVVQKIVNTIGLIAEEAIFTVGQAGLRYTAMDPSHVMLVDVSIPPERCARFDVDGAYKFALRVEDLKTVLARGSWKEQVVLSMDEAEEPEVFFKVYSKGGGRAKEFGLNCIESYGGETPLPRLDNDVTCIFTTDVLKDILDDIQALSDQVTIRVLPTEVSFSGRSDVGKAATTIDKNSADILELQCKTETKSTYNIEYVLDFLKAMKTEFVNVQFSSKKPIVIRCTLDPGYVDYYLAPRVADDYDEEKPKQSEPPHDDETVQTDNEAVQRGEEPQVEGESPQSGKSLKSSRF
jgi:proliferating cell nuclear antigen